MSYSCYFVLVFFSPFRITISSLFVRLICACSVFVCSLFLLVCGKGCGFWLWHSLDFSLTFCFIYFFYFFFFTSNKTKLTPPIFKIVLSKGILRTFANAIDSDQNAVWSGSPLFASKLGSFGIGKQCNPRSNVAELVRRLFRVVTVCLIYRIFCSTYNK